MGPPLELLYFLRGSDLAGPAWGPKLHYEAVTNTDLTHTMTLTIPQDQVLWLTGVSATITPVGGENADAMTVFVRDQAGNFLTVLHTDQDDAAANTPKFINFRPNIPLVGGTHELAYVSVASGAVQNKTRVFSASGIIIPRGNVGLF